MTERSSFDWRAGAIGGIVGTICYTIFAETLNVASNGAAAFVVPFRQMGAMGLGPNALSDEYDLLAAVSVGTVVHLVVGIVFGIAVAWAAAALKLTHKGGAIALGTAMGIGLYALNVFVIFPAVFPWFLGNDRLVQTSGHALFGAVTAAWLAFLPSTRDRRGSSRTA